jgi:hypothetical protein
MTPNSVRGAEAATMESPTIVFDHINKAVITAPSSPTLAAIAAAQQSQISTASGLPARRG